MGFAGSIFSSFYSTVADFGNAYTDGIVKVYRAVFKKPLLFLWRFLRIFVKAFFRGFIRFFAPAGEGREFTDDVIRGMRKCISVLRTHPGSFFGMLSYYVRRARMRYTFSVKNILLWILPVLVFAGTLTGLYILDSKRIALKVESGDTLLGFVEDEDGYYEAKQRLREKLGAYYSDSDLPDVSFSLVLTDKSALTDSGIMSERLLSLTDNELLNGCAVYCDGRLLGVLHSESDARRVLDDVLMKRKADTSSYVVSFAEEIEYRHGLYPEDAFLSISQFSDLINKSKKETLTYTTVEGDTPGIVCALYGMNPERLTELNGDKAESEVFEEGETLNVERYVTSLTFKEVRSEITTESVEFERMEISSNALYSGSSRVLSQGKNGYAQVTNLVTYVGGEKVSSAEFSRYTLTESIPERIQVGTKPLDEAYSNSMGGIFLWPIIGAYGINSDYGYRWGKLHAGIDLGMGNAPGTSLGKDIIAVAQGTVIVASVHSSYGYYLIIDHGNGLQTLYAHCLADSFYVTPGQVVVAGQPIARVGSTGYSTGPHLHFEVRVNGDRVNPRPYLGI